MENRDRTDAQGEQAGGTPYHEDEPIKGGRQGQDAGQDQSGRLGHAGEQGGQSGRLGQGGDEVDDEDSTGGSNVNSESGQPVRPQDPATRLSPDETSKPE
jgi:hypothetical protein